MIAANTVLHHYQDLLELSPENVRYVGIKYPIPQFTYEVLNDLCDESISILKGENPVLDLPCPIKVVGDLHGNLHDLLRILLISYRQKIEKFLFLGDYVDRGDYSLDVITLLLALQITQYNQYYLIRGNHEFPCVNGNYGFKAEIIDRYGDESLWVKFNQVFEYLQLAAIVGNAYFCVHGGISPGLTHIDQLKEYQLPITEYQSNETLADIVWSDPSEYASDFLESHRGCGKIFGLTRLKAFLRENSMLKMIRGHQCVAAGYEKLWSGTCWTVFSSSFYTDEENAAAFLTIDEVGKILPYTLKSQRYITRKRAMMTEKFTQIERTMIRPVIGTDIASSFQSQAALLRTTSLDRPILSSSRQKNRVVPYLSSTHLSRSFRKFNTCPKPPEKDTNENEDIEKKPKPKPLIPLPNYKLPPLPVTAAT